MGWAQLDDAQRRGIYKRFIGGENLAVLAREAGVPPATLSRRMREMRQFGEPAQQEAMFAGRGPKAENGRTYVVANPTDVHGVYADPYAWELALKCVQAMRPDHVCWGNDSMDMGVISTYSHTRYLPSVQEELDDEQNKRHDLQQAAGSGAQLWWLSDNHVLERYQRYMWSHAPEIAGLRKLQLSELLEIEASRMVETFEAGDTLRIIHGFYVRKHPGQSVMAHLLEDPGNRRGRITRSVMMGHVHRFAHVRLDNGVEGLECGCLQNLRPGYVLDQRKFTNWSHGMGFARYGKDWSQIVPAPFTLIGDRLVCRLEGQEHAVKVGKSYSGFS